MAEQIQFPNNPPQVGDQFTVGNTTYIWDDTPGLWRAFTTGAGGGGGGIIFSTELITASDPAWSPSIDGTFTFIAVGSGGSGGIHSLDDGGTTFALRSIRSNSGGGAGGAAIITTSGLTGQSYNINIGASATNTGANTSLAGGPGNPTTIIGNGVNINAGAGQGGDIGVNVVSAGGAGGTATGGSTNIPGGTAPEGPIGQNGAQGFIFNGNQPTVGADTTELTNFGNGGAGNYSSRDGAPSAASSTSDPGAVLVLYWVS